MRNTSAVLCLAMLAMAGWAVADTTWVAGGNVSGNWTAAGSPFMVLGDLTVTRGHALHVGPGVKVCFAGPYSITAHGCLSADGAEGDSVVFTTDTLANPGRWGGLRFDVADPPRELSYCVVEYATSDWGGGVYCGAYGISITHCAIRHNRATEYGGGLYVSTATLVLRDCVIADNTVAGVGGGAYLDLDGDCAISHCLFLGNTAPGSDYSGSGGGIELMYCNSLLVENCVFQGNESAWSGGAFDAMMPGASAVFNNCTFEDNSSARGGAVYSTFLDELTVDHCVFLRNHATGSGMAGGALVTWFIQTPTVRNSVFAHSTGYAISWALNTHHCVFDQNQPSSFNAESQAGLGRRSRVNINGDSTDQYFNVFEDPLFVDETHGDYHLTPASPCIDAGDPALPLDPNGTITDVGLFYFDQTALLPLQPVSIAFGNVHLDSVALRTVTMRNASAQPVTVLSAATTMPLFSAGFDTARRVIAVGDTLVFEVRFAPTQLGSPTASLILETDLTSRHVDLSGTGQAAYGTLLGFMTNFGALAPGAAETLSVGLLNSGNMAMHLDSVTATGVFHMAGFPASVGPNATAQLPVVFAPASEGQWVETLRVYSDAQNGSVLSAFLTGQCLQNPEGPSWFELLSPANHDTVMNYWYGWCEFNWHSSHDPYGGPAPTYRVWVAANGDSVSRPCTDTTISLSLGSLGLNIQWNTAVTWWVQAMNHIGAKECAERFHFVPARHPPSAVTPAAPALPQATALHANYPNPFNAATTFSYDLAKPGWARLRVFNTLGETVAELAAGEHAAGAYRLDWNAGQWPSGIYIGVLETRDKRFVQKVVLLK